MAEFDCFKCGGSGEVAFRHIDNGRCFQCGGTGRLAYRGRSGATFTPVAPIVPEGERSTAKQWAYFERLVPNDDEACRIMRAAGAPHASQVYVTRAAMSRAIDLAKGAVGR